MSGISHRTDEHLELYALGRLPEWRVATVEEHLLVCVSCQERLDEVELFALAMRGAIAGEPVAEPVEQERTGRFARLQVWSAWSMAGALAALVLAAGVYVHSGRNMAPLASLQLTAIRGGVQAVVVARETDITLADAPVDTVLHVEVVDATGGTIWTATPGADAGKVKITKKLAEGSYFVRLYDGAGKLLHEYGFRVR